MPNINITSSEGDTRLVNVPSGFSLMETLRDLGYDDILALCGGCCSCATCHVHITHDAAVSLAPIEEDEQMLLEMTDNYQADVSRLSCQIELTDEHEGLQVSLLEPE